MHFGNGDEDDYQGLKIHLESLNIKDFKIHIFPGNPYGLIEFTNKEEPI